MNELLNAAASPRTRAVENLRRYILRRGLREGDRLPAETRLAEEFDVSRMTLRAALGQLEREGLVRRERNQGCFCAIPRTSRDTLMSRTVVLISDHRVAPHGSIYGGGSDALVSGVIDGVSKRGLNFLRVHPDFESLDWVDDVIGARPQGVVVSCWRESPARQARLLARLAEASIPVATWNESPLLDPYDSVSTDHVTGTEDLVHALADAGKRRILRVWTTSTEQPWVQAHNVGYDRAVAERGLESLPAVYVEGLPEREEASEKSFRIRTRHLAGYLAEHLAGDAGVDAIMVVTDCEVFNVLAACRLFGRSDMAVTGYDNYWESAHERAWEPGVPFATVDKNNHLLGEQIVELLMDRIGGQIGSPEPHRRLVRQQVVLAEGRRPVTAARLSE